MKILTLFMPFSANHSTPFATFNMRFLLCIALFLCGNQRVAAAQNSFAQASPQIDSTRDGFGRAKMGMYFKKNWDFRNAIIGLNARWSAKNSQTLILPKKISHYKPVFDDSFNVWNADIWSKGQPWGRFHPDNVHQFYGDPQVFVGNGCLHLLNEPIATPIVIENQPPSEQARMKRAQVETNAILPNLVKTGWVNAKGEIVASTQSNIDESAAIASQTQSQNPDLKPAILIPYSIGLANTFHSKNFTYGFFAIRSKNPSGPATWPAWWLTGRNNWPPEIDIFEMYGGATGKQVHTQTMTIHTGKVETHTKQMMMKKIRLSEDTDTAFHVYACLWTPTRIEFYTDNVRVKSVKLNKWMRQYYREPMYLILNNALENKYLPNLVESGNRTSDFQVDWVQVYQAIPQTTP
jgi:hypothetical protein